ncbi:sensor histidine kinase, partial [Streptomyces fradiae]
MTHAEYPWLLPSDLARAADPDPRGGRRRRTVRDWAVDTLAFAFACLVGIAVVHNSRQINESDAVVLADEILGAVACLLLWARRGRPAATAVAASVIGIVTPATGGAVVVAVFGAAVRLPPRRLAAVAGAAFVCSTLQGFLRPDPEIDGVVNLVVNLVMLLLATGWGMLVRTRRQLVAAQRERGRGARAGGGGGRAAGRRAAPAASAR